VAENEAGGLNSNDLIAFASRIVAAYVGNNTVSPDELPDLIRLVHDALAGLPDGEPEPDPLKPAVPVKKSVSEHYQICQEDGKKFKSHKRHQRTANDKTPEQNREKLSLPAD
jgi:predicted transcriptional regulator